MLYSRFFFDYKHLHNRTLNKLHISLLQVPGNLRDVPELLRHMPGSSRNIPERLRDVPGHPRHMPRRSRKVPERSREFPELFRKNNEKELNRRKGHQQLKVLLKLEISGTFYGRFSESS